MILDDAAAVLAIGSVCDPCLGRAFADRGRGLTNRERGRALRTALALRDDRRVDEPDGCWVCETTTSTYDEWADRAAEALSGLAFETYLVGTRPPAWLSEHERVLRARAGLSPTGGEPFRAEANREVGKRLGRRFDADVDHAHPDVVVLLDVAADDVEVQVNPVYLYGRYRKLERGVSQTVLDCPACGGRGTVWTGGRAEDCPTCGGTGRVAERSVEELLAPPIVAATGGSRVVFHGAGREPADALVLGGGRPFVVEVKEPRKRELDVDALEAEVNAFAGGAVEVRDLTPARPELVERLKTLALRQTYRLTVEFGEDVSEDAFRDALADLSGPPARYRGASPDSSGASGTPESSAAPDPADTSDASGASDAADESERLRTLHDVSGELTDVRSGTVELEVEAGVDVERVVSGDADGPDPSLAALLGTSVTVTAVDVVDVSGRDEPLAPPEFLR